MSRGSWLISQLWERAFYPPQHAMTTVTSDQRRLEDGKCYSQVLEARSLAAGASKVWKATMPPNQKDKVYLLDLRGSSTAEKVEIRFIEEPDTISATGDMEPIYNRDRSSSRESLVTVQAGATRSGGKLLIFDLLGGGEGGPGGQRISIGSLSNQFARWGLLPGGVYALDVKNDGDGPTNVVMSVIWNEGNGD